LIFNILLSCELHVSTTLPPMSIGLEFGYVQNRSGSFTECKNIFGQYHNHSEKLCDIVESENNFTPVMNFQALKRNS